MLSNKLAHLQQRPAELEAKNKRLSRALQQSENLSQKIFHASSSIMAIHRIKDWSFGDLNEAALALGGFTRKEFANKMMPDGAFLENPKLVPMAADELNVKGKAHILDLKEPTKYGQKSFNLLSLDA
jgi:hypothetical protein